MDQLCDILSDDVDNVAVDTHRVVLVDLRASHIHPSVMCAILMLEILHHPSGVVLVVRRIHSSPAQALCPPRLRHVPSSCLGLVCW